MEAALATLDREEIEALQEVFAVIYCKVTGAEKAPLFVTSAAALDNSKKSNK